MNRGGGGQAKQTENGLENPCSARYGHFLYELEVIGKLSARPRREKMMVSREDVKARRFDVFRGKKSEEKVDAALRDLQRVRELGYTDTTWHPLSGMFTPRRRHLDELGFRYKGPKAEPSARDSEVPSPQP